MKKRIIIIAFLLFLSSFIVILIFGRKNVIEYNKELMMMKDNKNNKN